MKENHTHTRMVVHEVYLVENHRPTRKMPGPRKEESPFPTCMMSSFGAVVNAALAFPCEKFLLSNQLEIEVYVSFHVPANTETHYHNVREEEVFYPSQRLS